MGLTDDRDDPRLKNIQPSGMQEAYLVLSEEERAKGFVRPVRDTYYHVGVEVCGKPSAELLERRTRDGTLPEGTVAYVCTGEPGHDGECFTWRPVTRALLDRLEETGFLGGCGRSTSMAAGLAETYARDPGFYGGTYCATCKTHPRVGARGEFVWSDYWGLLTGTKHARELRDAPRVGT